MNDKLRDRERKTRELWEWASIRGRVQSWKKNYIKVNLTNPVFVEFPQIVMLKIIVATYCFKRNCAESSVFFPKYISILFLSMMSKSNQRHIRFSHSHHFSFFFPLMQLSCLLINKINPLQSIYRIFVKTHSLSPFLFTILNTAHFYNSHHTTRG